MGTWILEMRVRHKWGDPKIDTVIRHVSDLDMHGKYHQHAYFLVGKYYLNISQTCWWLPACEDFKICGAPTTGV